MREEKWLGLEIQNEHSLKDQAPFSVEKIEMT